MSAGHKAMKKIKLPLPASELLPHREAMLLVDELHFYDRVKSSGLILATARPDTIFTNNAGGIEDGFLEEVVVLEMMAQAYACLRGYEDRLGGSDPSLGFLVGVRHFNSLRRVEVCEALSITVVTTTQIGEFFIAAAAVRVAAEKVAEAELKLWVPTDSGGSES